MRSMFVLLQTAYHVCVSQHFTSPLDGPPTLSLVIWDRVGLVRRTQACRTSAHLRV